MPAVTETKANFTSPALNGAASSNEIPLKSSNGSKGNNAASVLPSLPLPSLQETCQKYLASVRPFLTAVDFERTEEAVTEFLLPGGQGEILQTRLSARFQEAEKLRPENDKKDEANAATSTHQRGASGNKFDSTNVTSRTFTSADLIQLNASRQKRFKTGTAQSSIPEDFEIYATKFSDDRSHVDTTTNNWLIDWWNEYSYLAYREPLVVNVSYFFVFPDDRVRRAPVARAASILTSAMKFKKELVDGTLPPDMNRTTPMCMRQYDFMFNTTRIPVAPSDFVLTYDQQKYNHVAVVRNNRFFVFDMVIEEKNETGSIIKRALTEQEIERQLQEIVDQTGEVASPAIGVLTCDNRDVWTTNRDTLIEHHSENASSLQKLESAAFLLCLDDGRPVTGEEAARACWHGDGENRWFDKSLQFIVFENGRAGFCGEHSLMDATSPARMCDYVISDIQNNTNSAIEKLTKSSTKLPEIEDLDFRIPPALLKRAIPEALARFEELVEKHDLRVSCYRGYGKDYIKTVKVSPDAYVQMAIQLAWYKMRGTWVATYESAGMRGYNCGRTETCRSVGDESVEFVIAMEENDVPATTKAQLARRAIMAQSSTMVSCLKGKGIDRHLLGLRLSLRPDEETPKIFLDTTYALTSHWTLSTSQIPSEHIEGYGWGEVVTDGFGVAYLVKGDSLRFNITGIVGASAVPPMTGSKPSAKVRKAGIPGGGAYEDLPNNRVRWMKHYLEESLEDLRRVFVEEAALLAATAKAASAAVSNEQTLKQKTRTPKLSASNPSLHDRIPPLSMSLPAHDLGAIATSGLRSPIKTISRADSGLSLAYPRRCSITQIYEGDGNGVLDDLGQVEVRSDVEERCRPELRHSSDALDLRWNTCPVGQLVVFFALFSETSLDADSQRSQLPINLVKIRSPGKYKLITCLVAIHHLSPRFIAE